MNYWILTTEYPPFYGGGISTYCQFTAEMFSKRGHQVTVFVQDSSLSDFKEEYYERIRIIRFSPKRIKTSIALGYEASLSYAFAEIVGDYLEKEGIPDVLESQEYNGIAYYIQQFKLLGYSLFKDLNILITCHAPSFLYLEYNQVPYYQFPEYWTGQMEKSCMLSADILISPSRYLISDIKKRMGWREKQEAYLVNPMAIEGDVLDSLPNFVPQRLVCFGKLSPLKGTFQLLQYFDNLWSNGYRFQLEIVGSTTQIFHPEGRSMGDLVKNKYRKFLKEDLLRLHEEMPPFKAKEFIIQANVIIVPSLVDNLPYTVLEAMSLGKVVLASKQGGQSEVIEDGINGFLFDHTIQEDFQNKLLNILSLNEVQIKSIGGNARKTIYDNFHPEVVYQRKIDIIQQYLSNKVPKLDFPFTESQNTPQTYLSLHESDNTLLSVVIPYYNMGDYIEECISSVYASDYKDIEVIIIDDGSTEPASQEKLKAISSNFPVTIYSKKNEGLSATRNYGALKAKGYYLAFLDADDTVESSYYSKAVSVLNQYRNVCFVGCWVQYFGESTGPWPAFNPEPPYLLLHNMLNSSALIYKKNSFLTGGQNDSSLIYGMEDWESVINMVSHGFGGVVLPEFLYNYRVRKGSMARSFTREKKLFLYNLIVQKHARIFHKYGEQIAILNASNGSLLDFDNPTLVASSGFIVLFKDHVKNKLKNSIKRNEMLRRIAYSVYKRIS